MKTATTMLPDVTPFARGRLADYVELTKPKVAVLVLFTVVAGALLAAGGMPDARLLFNVVFGTALVVSGASALNQLIERQTDTLMQRTENRPLPSGRLQGIEVGVFGLIVGVAGIVYLATMLPSPLAAAVAAVAFVSYVFIYTPLKTRTTLNTLVGAVPGALPPVIGWCAVSGTIDSRVLALFFILYFWQVPHFLAIAWMYRGDYGRAGLCMLPVQDRYGSMTGRQMVTYCLALVAVSLLPAFWDGSNRLYVVAAIVLGLGFLWCCIGFFRRRSDHQARRVLRASLIYLPALLGVLLLNQAL
jgi:protoheme IX farnesyltransferase